MELTTWKWVEMGRTDRQRKISQHPLVVGLVVAVIGAAATACFTAFWPSSSPDGAGPHDAPGPLPRSAEGPANAPASIGAQANRSVWLMDLQPVADGARWDTGSRTLRATPYPNSVIGRDGLFDKSTMVDYNIGGKYSRFQATIGVDDNAPRDVKYRFEILADGQSRFSRTLGPSEISPVDVDVTGVLRLTLLVEDSPGDYSGFEGAIWGNAMLVSR